MPTDRCELLCLDVPRAERVRERLDDAWIARASTQARALGDGTRLTVAAALREGGELCVCDLGWIMGRAENLVGHHLRVLRDAELARSRREGKIVFYSLTALGRRLVDTHLGRAAAPAGPTAGR